VVVLAITHIALWNNSTSIEKAKKMGKLRSKIRATRIAAGMTASVPKTYSNFSVGDKLQWFREEKWVDVYHVFDEESAEWSAECMEKESPEHQRILGLDGFVKCQCKSRIDSKN